MATIQSAIESPYSVIRSCMRGVAGSPSTPAREWLSAVQNHFADAFTTEEAIAQIPYLTKSAHSSGALRPNTLVRYVGMVQDTFEAELYPPSVVITSSSMEKRVELCAFRDTLSGDFEPASMRDLQNRYSYYLVPLPGEAGWARALHSGSSAPSPAPLGSETQQQQQQQQQQHAKRVRDDGHEPTATHDTPLAPLPPSGSPAVLGGIVGGGSSSGLHSFASVGAPPNADAAQLHFPLLVDSEVPVLLRTYPAPPAPRNKSTAAAAAASVSDDMEDEEGGDAPSDHLLRINDIVEVIGIFTADPVLSSFAGSGGGGATGEGKPRQKRPHHHNAAGAAAGAAAASDMDMDGSTASGGGACAECSCDANDDDDAQMGAAAPLLDDPDALAMMTAHNPPPSLVPRVHAVLMRRLSPSYPALARVTLPASRVMWAGSADATSSGTQQQQQQSSSSAGAVVAASPAAAPWSASGAIEKQRDAEAVAAQHMQLVVDAATPLIGSSTSSGPAAVLSALRSAALSTLTHACGGDALVGEYLLLHLVSRVYARRDMYALGKFTLALTGLPECRVAATAAAAVAAAASSSSSSSSSSSIGAAGAAESRVAPTAGSERVPIPLPLEGGASPLACSIARSLSSLLPRLAVLPLRIDVLNSVVCGPLKDALTSRLHSGLLQLPVGTSVLVDETVMNDGHLGVTGVKNLKAIGTLATAQTVEYEFPYCEPAAWPTDCPVLLLVAGQKSFFKTDATLPLLPEAVARLQQQQSSGGSGAAASAATVELAAAASAPLLRAYIAAARALPFKMTSAAGEAIQSAWLAGRQRSPDADESGAPPLLTDDDLHRWLTLARLVAVSWGEAEISPARIHAMLELERARASRCGAAASVGGGKQQQNGSAAGVRTVPATPPRG